MKIERYITVQAVKTRENELIPVWDERVVFQKTEMYGNTISVKGIRGNTTLIECIYDLKNKALSVGIELNYYPVNTPFKVNENVLVEKRHRVLAKAKIVQIVFEEYELEVKKGKKFEGYWVTRFPNVTVDKESLYAIKCWKPFYILDSGEKIEWEHKLYKQAEV